MLAERPDAVVHGAHAVNAYAATERMTQDIDVLCTQAANLAEAVRARLAERFHLAVRVREVVPATGYRVYQLRDAGNRHLVDVRGVAELPGHVDIGGVSVVELPELMVMKSRALAARRNREKGLSDRLDLHRLLNAHPELREPDGVVARRLAAPADKAALEAWREVVAERVEPDAEEDEFGG